MFILYIGDISTISECNNVLWHHLSVNTQIIEKNKFIKHDALINYLKAHILDESVRERQLKKTILQHQLNSHFYRFTKVMFQMQPCFIGLKDLNNFKNVSHFKSTSFQSCSFFFMSYQDGRSCNCFGDYSCQFRPLLHNILY